MFPGSCAQGRLEVRVGDVWGTVCSKAFTVSDKYMMQNVQAVCRTLGQPWEGAEYAVRGQVTVVENLNDDIPINLVYIYCDETASDFPNDCRKPVTADTCTHADDVEIICKPPAPPMPPMPPTPPPSPPMPPMPPSPPSPNPPSPAAGLVRLVGGPPGGQEGRLELYHQAKWGTMCFTSSFDQSAAKAVCRQLNRAVPDNSLASFGFSGTRYGTTDLPIVATWTFCPLDEPARSLQYDCDINGYGADRCDHSRDVWIRCPY
uniref:SRCR domain-containing protein n=2 Tax=Chlamydomonas euryale TaxID=1486919 RepID=A0A7R9V476_9CHLO|mmetsp:Transcript_17165/g.51530  ORF Transcript_17165/g.51530 Transcript_17165/m.51530 type:complete len:261 (+) Transcript_17165:1462-2244(+)|eukprot:363474-Chlamydomonas_euryale.AAC.12